MTSWGYITQLFLFVLCMIDPSKEGCLQYFQMESWARNLTDTIQLVKTKDPKDIMECTLERECHQGRNICHVLYHCFPKVSEEREKCEGGTLDSDTVHFYHFMCFLAKIYTAREIDSTKEISSIAKACDDYGTACRVESQISSAITSDRKTLPPPTTAPTTTPTTTAPTTMPETTTATTLRPTSTTKFIPTACGEIYATRGSNGPISLDNPTKSYRTGEDKNTEILTLRILIAISAFLNAVALVYSLFTCHQGRRDGNRQLNSNTPLAYGNGNKAPATHLKESPECHSVIMDSTDPTTNECHELEHFIKDPTQDSTSLCS